MGVMGSIGSTGRNTAGFAFGLPLGQQARDRVAVAAQLGQEPGRRRLATTAPAHPAAVLQAQPQPGRVRAGQRRCRCHYRRVCLCPRRAHNSPSKMRSSAAAPPPGQEA